MSIMNAFVVPDGVHIFTDAGFYEADGTVAGLGSKVFPLPRWNAAVAAVGGGWLLPLLAGAFAECDTPSFDELPPWFGSIVRRCLDMASAYGTAAHLQTCIVGLAGWSESRGKPGFFTVASSNRFEGAAFEPVQSTRFLSTANACDPRSFDPARPEETGLAMMRALRGVRFDSLNTADRRKIYGVGGWCQHTLVGRDEVTTRVLERWPDRIGHPINPKEKASFGVERDGTIG
ncbi:MAG: hypothetical protein HZA66_05835 [Rhodopseudomonas palustris]|uniref:Uncharacterized protein n=1 Tax=Rhodopseudomonas palustris TaxID=1076 RepID=A0A933RVF7_RHOPL|nr:hypothetical protein [Rhodopseudomonas palustris]